MHLPHAFTNHRSGALQQTLLWQPSGVLYVEISLCHNASTGAAGMKCSEILLTEQRRLMTHLVL